ncbi:glycosyltransferase family 4 protein [Salinibacterium sp. PAMC 21357]|uniref:glycosyltransferase family 4 protein n=1 Tax=Salinibacterium sp. PAMC 21357 TaxID=1112215 RepID=UPI00114710DF|nr:glycosyltransferase family 4 protein [Salinibacterium sp. PAMC 21357]
MTITDRLVRNRSRLPLWLNKLIDSVAKNPDGIAGKIASLVLGGGAGAVPKATDVPSTEIRLYIGSTNYAGQGYQWARAMTASYPGVGARNMAVELPGGFAFPADSLVPVAIYNRSKAWQQAEFQAASAFTHVLIEAERPLFGSLYGRDVAREIAALTAQGVSMAFLSHGTDARSPRRHLATTPWSHFADSPTETAATQADVDLNLALIAAHNLPVFVSTPDLLLDLPSAKWCPVVIDPRAWQQSRPSGQQKKVVVAHAPSMGSAKGTHLIDDAVRNLAAQGIIEYRPVSGVASADMPAVFRDADIVLDQFRAGSYGVAACEAMASGRVVVGHVLPDVRRYVRESTGRDLPIVEANPTTIAATILALVDDRERMRSLGTQGEEFVAQVHSGALSAAVLNDNWIHADDLAH